MIFQTLLINGARFQRISRQMCENPNKSHVEAWKSVIEFCKTIISISSAILTALIGYYIVSQPELSSSHLNKAPPALLVLAMLFAMFGFGRSIKSISQGTSVTSGIALANLSVFFLTIGILSIALIKVDKGSSLDAVISQIQQNSKKINKQLTQKQMKTLSVTGDKYIITYETDKGDVMVTYSTTENRIIDIK